MDLYNKTQPWLGRKSVRGALVVVGLVLALGIIYSIGNKEEIKVTDPLLPLVSVTTATQYAGNSVINLIGTVRAFSEAAVTAETAGRVTDVRVRLGDTVAAGQIIATLANANQRASLLQAEGSYDAALAAAAQNNVGTDEAQTRLLSAQNAAISAIQASHNTVEGVLYNNIDQFFANPDSYTPDLQISGAGYGGALINKRVEFKTTIAVAKARSAAITTSSEFTSEVAASKALLAETISFVDLFIQTLNDQDSYTKYTKSQIVSFGTAFNAARGSLIQLQSQLDSALSGIESAKDGLNRAELAASGGTNSAADAQVKQALGSLRAAQANLAKTILRSPISGTVNSLSVRAGDFVGAQSQIAEVANNNALEVVTYAGENDRSVINIGDTVQIENEFAGTITEIAPAVDTATGKTEIRIASESDSFQNGDSVKITKEVVSATTTKVVIPLSAVKFQINDGSVFVVEDGKLAARAVTLGTIRGGSVEILDGLSSTDEFVGDVRGMVVDTPVEIIQ